jgi:hypothetical protein
VTKADRGQRLSVEVTARAAGLAPRAVTISVGKVKR